MPRFRIHGLNHNILGHVTARNKGLALQAAVDAKLVSGRRQIKLVELLPENDIFEQSFKDIYGVPKSRTLAR